MGALPLTTPGAALVGALRAAPDLDGWMIVERLLTDLAPSADRIWLVVDDAHELGAEALRQLELLVMRASPELRFVLAARHDVRLGLHRLRLEGELAEIRAPDLRFSLAEARELFAVAGVELPEQALAVPQERTEGWAAGLRLASLSLAGHPDPGRFAPGPPAASDGGRIPAGRGAGPAARRRQAAAANLHPGAGQGGGRPADRGQRRGAGAAGSGGCERVRGVAGCGAVVVPLSPDVRQAACA